MTISPRAARTRTALLRAGADLLADRPIEAIAVDEVVATAGVSKGSFFNHFSDKHAFAAAVSMEIRQDLERRIGHVNAFREEPLARLAGGLIGAAAFALRYPQRTTVLMRNASGMLVEEHPLNAGLLDDLRSAAAAGLLADRSEVSGVLFWLGCCQILMEALAAERERDDTAGRIISDVLTMGLRGLGADAAVVERLGNPTTVEAELARACEVPSSEVDDLSSDTSPQR